MKKLLLSLLFVAQPALAAEEALTECRQIEEIAERVACYDKIADSNFPMDASDRVETAAPPQTTPPSQTTPPPQTAPPPEISNSNAVPDAQSLFGKNDAEAKRIVETSMAIEQINQIEAKITDVRKSAYKKLTVTLDNGQTWRQLDHKPLPLKSGEIVIVREASLGSYLMEKQAGSRSIRVKRVN